MTPRRAFGRSGRNRGSGGCAGPAAMTGRRVARPAAAAALASAAMACTLVLTAPRAFAQGPAPETVVDVRVHGNHSIPDAEVLALAGVAVGDVVAAGDLDSVQRHGSRPAAGSRRSRSASGTVR